MCTLTSDDVIPGKIQAMTITETTCDSVTLNWKPPDVHPIAAKIYQVFYKASNSMLWISALKNEECFYGLTILGLKPCTEYDFCIKVKNKRQVLPPECSLLLKHETLPSVPPSPKKFPVQYTSGNRFSLFISLPNKEESGREVNAIYVRHYNLELEHFKTVKHAVEEADIPQTRVLKLNCGPVDNTAYVTATLMNIVGISKESEMVNIDSRVQMRSASIIHQQELSKMQDQLTRLAEDNTRLSEQLKKERQDADNKIARLGEELKAKCQSHQILFDQAIRVQQRLDQKLRKDITKLQVQSYRL